LCRATYRSLSWRQKWGKIIVFAKDVKRSQGSRKLASRRYLRSLWIALGFALTVYPTKASAQIVGDLLVNVPFPFHAGNAKLPAGEYLVHLLDDSNLTVMKITTVDGSLSALFQVQETDAKSAPTKSELIFNKYGEDYFLATLFEQGSATGNQVAESRDEKAISQRTMQAEERVPAYRRTQRGN
jgi:hypothetical protein